MRTLTLLTASLLVVSLTGCSSSSTTPSSTPSRDNSTPSTSTNTPPSTQSQTQEAIWPHVRSLEFAGKQISPYMVDVDIPVKMKVIASGADEVDIVMSENGQETPTLIVKILNPNPIQKEDEQIFEYVWTPPADSYGGFFWAIAKSGAYKSESAEINVKIKR